MHSYKRAIIAHTGPMFSGKTSALMADVRKLRIAGYNVALFKPGKDDRYSDHDVVNHDGNKIVANNVFCFNDIIEYIKHHPGIDVIAIDEVQFIESNNDKAIKDFIGDKINIMDFVKSDFDIKQFIDYVISNELTLIVSGLDLDSDLRPFRNTSEIFAYATHVYKHKAVCTDCGSYATTSYCKVEKSSKELIGGQDIYTPLCLSCYMKRNGERGE